MAVSGISPNVTSGFAPQAARPTASGIPLTAWQMPVRPPQPSLPAHYLNTTALTPPVSQPTAPQWTAPGTPAPMAWPMPVYGPPQNMTWMPVIRTVTPPQPTTEPAAEKPAETTEAKPAAKTAAEAATEETIEAPGAKKLTKAAEEPAKPLTPAQETGKKVGDFVTQLLEENPQLQDKLDQLNLTAMMSNPESFANRFRESFQRSRLFRMTKWLDRRFVSLFPREMEPTVEEVLKWLRTPAGNTGRTGRSWMSVADEPMVKDAVSTMGKAGRKGKALASSTPSIEELLGSLGGVPA